MPMRVRDQRAGARAAPRSDRDAVLARPADEVGHDEEVAGEAHLADHADLRRQALFVFFAGNRAPLHYRLAQLFQALQQAAPCFLAQEVFGAEISRHGIRRQHGFAELQLQVAATRDLEGVVDGLGHVLEQLRHLARRLQVLLFAVAPPPLRIAEQRAVVNAHARFVGFVILRANEAHVVGRHDRHAVVGRHLQRAVDVALLGFAPRSLQLDVVTVAEQREPAFDGLARLLFAAVHDRATEIAVARAGKGDQPDEVVGAEPGAIDGRDTAVLAFQIRATDEAREIAVADVVLTQQHQRRRLLPLTQLAHAQVDADDRLHARRLRRAIELHHREQVALVGERDRGHARRTTASISPGASPPSL